MGDEVKVEFKPGDLVRLKSGGPWMTVHEVTADNVICHWWPTTDNGSWYHAGSAIESLPPTSLLRGKRKPAGVGMPMAILPEREEALQAVAEAAEERREPAGWAEQPLGKVHDREIAKALGASPLGSAYAEAGYVVTERIADPTDDGA